MKGTATQTTQLKATQLGQTGLDITLQPQYSLIERDVEREILPFAKSKGIGVIVYSPMGSIVGFRSPEQVDPLIEAANLELSEDDISTIEGAQ